MIGIAKFTRDKEGEEMNEDEKEKDEQSEILDAAPPPTAEELQHAAILIGMEEMKKGARRFLPFIHCLQAEVNALAEIVEGFTLKGESPIESVDILRGLLEVKKAYHALDMEVARLT